MELLIREILKPHFRHSFKDTGTPDRNFRLVLHVTLLNRSADHREIILSHIWGPNPPQFGFYRTLDTLFSAVFQSYSRLGHEVWTSLACYPSKSLRGQASDHFKPYLRSLSKSTWGDNSVEDIPIFTCKYAGLLVCLYGAFWP